MRSGSSLVSSTSDRVSRRSPCHAVTRSLAQVRPEWNGSTSTWIGSAYEPARLKIVCIDLTYFASPTLAAAAMIICAIS